MQWTNCVNIQTHIHTHTHTCIRSARENTSTGEHLHVDTLLYSYLILYISNRHLFGRGTMHVYTY
jgi:hypothetical protein